MDAALWYGLTADNRRLAADVFDSLDDEQWRVPSLCAGWTVRDIAAHLTLPFEVSAPRYLMALLRERVSVDRVADVETRKLARRPTEQIVASLRANADRRFSPPRIGPGGQLADSCIHLRDAARPLHLTASPPPSTWAEALSFLVSANARTIFVPRGRLTGLALSATDSPFAYGSGVEVRGPGEALALAVTGRRVALRDLSGDGVDVLRDRLG